jgi:hypothetical protein
MFTAPLASIENVSIDPTQVEIDCGWGLITIPDAVVTVKSVALVAVFPATVTVIFPVVAPAGTDVVILVAVLAAAVAVVPLNRTVLFAGVVLKFVPVIVTVVPIGPEAGLKLVIVGSAGVVTVKSVALVAVLPATVTVILPVVAPAGTVVVILVVVLAVAVAVVPLNLTVLLVGVALKFVPVIVTVVPATPDVGVKEVIVGDVPVVTVKSAALCTVTQFIVTEILPVVANAGTDVSIVVVVLADTVAGLML